MNVLVISKAIVLNDEEKILVLRRSSHLAQWPGAWDVPGGYVEEAEDPAAGAVRETLEETGITISDLQPLYIGSQHYPNQFIITTIFQAHSTATNIQLSHEHNEYRWVTSAEFMDIEIRDKYKDAVRNLSQYKRPRSLLGNQTLN